MMMSLRQYSGPYTGLYAGPYNKGRKTLNWLVGRLLSKVVSAHAQSFTFFGLYYMVQHIVQYMVQNTV